MVSLLEDTKPAKPRLMYRDRVWVCRSIVRVSVWPHVVFRLGYGRDPVSAFKDWEAQQ